MNTSIPLNISQEYLIRIQHGEPLFDQEQDIVTVSKKDYEEMLKAKRNVAYLKKIDLGIAQLESGMGQQHDLIEVPADE